MRRVLCAICAVLLLMTGLRITAGTESTTEKIPEPTLQPDAAPYDADHPEDLLPEQLYGLSAILMTQDKGEVIFEKDPDEIRYPASTTKILTVLLGIQMVDDLNQTVTVSETAMMIPETDRKIRFLPVKVLFILCILL